MNEKHARKCLGSLEVDGHPSKFVLSGASIRNLALVTDKISHGHPSTSINSRLSRFLSSNVCVSQVEHRVQLCCFGLVPGISLAFRCKKILTLSDKVGFHFPLTYPGYCTPFFAAHWVQRSQRWSTCGCLSYALLRTMCYGCAIDDSESPQSQWNCVVLS